MDSSGVGGTGSNDRSDSARDAQASVDASLDSLAGALGVAATASFDNPAAQRAVAEAIATQTPIGLSGPVCYGMQPGQTLQDVATAFGTTVRDLAIANDIVSLDTVQPGQTISVPGPQDKPEIGSLSAQYESGTRGPGTVSTGNGDIGGVSYGSYQLSTAAGRPAEFLANEGVAWSADFAGLQPGTRAFSQAWRDVAAREPEAFQQAQHDYIGRTHYQPQVDRVERRTTVAGVDGGIAAAGVDLEQHSRALQNAAWSTGVHHGPASNIVANAVRDVLAAGVQEWDARFDRDVIDAVYTERGRRDANGELAHFSRNSADVQRGVAARFVGERADALGALDAEDRALRGSLGLDR
ncbi:MAG TPA: LysM domain-containing protein [Luteimonas sp.]|nr:LysM domain-containing protein [Luteimonas sp.]